MPKPHTKKDIKKKYINIKTKTKTPTETIKKAEPNLLLAVNQQIKKEQKIKPVNFFSSKNIEIVTEETIDESEERQKELDEKKRIKEEKELKRKKELEEKRRIKAEEELERKKELEEKRRIKAEEELKRQKVLEENKRIQEDRKRQLAAEQRERELKKGVQVNDPRNPQNLYKKKNEKTVVPSQNNLPVVTEKNFTKNPKETYRKHYCNCNFDPNYKMKCNCPFKDISQLKDVKEKGRDNTQDNRRFHRYDCNMRADNDKRGFDYFCLCKANNCNPEQFEDFKPNCAHFFNAGGRVWRKDKDFFEFKKKFNEENNIVVEPVVQNEVAQKAEAKDRQALLKEDGSEIEGEEFEELEGEECEENDEDDEGDYDGEDGDIFVVNTNQADLIQDTNQENKLDPIIIPKKPSEKAPEKNQNKDLKNINNKNGQRNENVNPNSRIYHNNNNQKEVFQIRDLRGYSYLFSQRQYDIQITKAEEYCRKAHEKPTPFQITGRDGKNYLFTQYRYDTQMYNMQKYCYNKNQNPIWPPPPSNPITPQMNNNQQNQGNMNMPPQQMHLQQMHPQQMPPQQMPPQQMHQQQQRVNYQPDNRNQNMNNNQRNQKRNNNQY